MLYSTVEDHDFENLQMDQKQKSEFKSHVRVWKVATFYLTTHVFTQVQIIIFETPFSVIKSTNIYSVKPSKPSDRNIYTHDVLAVKWAI